MNDISSNLLPVELAACQTRRKRLQSALAAANVDALLITCEKDIHYLTGFVGHESWAMVTMESGGLSGIIISDSRYDEYLEPWRNAKAADVVMGIRHRLSEAVRRICELRKITRLGIQAEHVTIAGRAKLATALGESRLVNTTELVGTLRMCKDDLEIQTILRAEAFAQDAISAAVNQISVGMTELEFSAVLEYEMKSRGAQGSSFTPIIAAGTKSSIIHYSTGSSPILPGVLLVDWGATIDGYNSDLTRTFGIGEMPAKIRDMYAVVLEAQLAAIEAIAPGKVCADIDAVARNIIKKAGYGEYFGHGLGHGLGMDVHEAPYFNDLSTDVRLESGMVMTVEPGIYVPGLGGVRIEDDVLVTPGGRRVLSDWPKDLPSAVLEPAMTGTRP